MDINDKSLISSEEIEVHLKTFINSPSEQQRIRAYEFLRKYGDDLIVRKLQKIYHPSDTDKKSYILKILLGINSTYSLGKFVELYFESSPYDRKTLSDLIKGKGIFLFSFLVNYLKNNGKNSPIAKEINSIIMGSGYFKNMQILLNYPSGRVILYGLRQAYKYPVMEIIDLIKPHLKSKDWQIRYNSLMVITRINIDFAKEYILRALNDPIEKIQVAAIEHIATSLGSYKDKITEILSEDDEELKKKILKILKSSGGLEFIPKLIQFVKKDDENFSVLAMETINTIVEKFIKNNEIIEEKEEFLTISMAIGELTKEKYKKELTREIRNLLKIVGSIALIIILENYDESVPFTQSNIVNYVKGIDLFFSEEILLKMSNMDEKHFRLYLKLIVSLYGREGINIILGKIDNLSGEKLLIVGENLLNEKIDRNSIKKAFSKFLESTDLEKRRSAYYIVSKCGGAEVIPKLKKDLLSGNGELVKLAINSLSSINSKEALAILKNIYLDKKFQKFETEIIDSIIFRKEFDVIIILLEFLKNNEITNKKLLVSKILERIKNSYFIPDYGKLINEIVNKFDQTINSLKDDEIKMVISLLKNGKKPGDLELIKNLKEIISLVPSVWNMEIVEFAILLIAPNMIFTMDKIFIEEKLELMDGVKYIINKVKLLFIIRLLFPKIFGDGSINSEKIIEHFKNKTPGIISAVYILLKNGDYSLKREILLSLRLVNNRELFYFIKDMIDDINENDLKEYILEIIGNIKSGESHKFLISISSDENNPLSEKAKFILEEARSDELL